MIHLPSAQLTNTALGASPNQPTSTDASTPPSVAPGNTRLPPTTTSPFVPTDAVPTTAGLSHVDRGQQAVGNQSAVGIGRKRPREAEPESSLEGRPATLQFPTSQPHGTESLGPCPGPVIPPPAQISNISLLLNPQSTQPSPPSPGDTRLNGGDPVTRRVIYRLRDFLTFTEVHFPATIEFIPETIAVDSVRYVSARTRGVWFQVTPAWLEAKGLLSPLSGPTYVPRRVLSSAISDHLREKKSYGFQHTYPVEGLGDLENLEVATLWWYGDKDGDGAVWPNGFGDLLVKWLRPGSLRDFLEWLDGV
jgi:hypothetical protein